MISAASAAAAGSHQTVGLLLATWIGLTVSDGWKYWAGRLAHRIPAAARMAASPRVVAARESVLKRLAITIIVARFVPGTRIPLNIACGLFHVPFAPYISLIITSAAIYIGLAYGLFLALGELLGEQILGYVPFVVVPIVLALVLYMVWRARRASRQGDNPADTPAGDA